MDRLLDKLSLPDDLKKLSSSELSQLANEIRQEIVESVSTTGGHLASNLGAVELTIGLYSVLNPFYDKIVWDVGHQTYVHKILTGRLEKMNTLRQFGGLSGFPKRSESNADAFGTGHASTSISAALGMARAKAITGKKYKVAAVIGDGALTGGMAFEALNDASRLFTDIIIILNDNGMSISRNVGGLSRYLGKIRTGKKYIMAKKRVKSLLSRIPFFGVRMVKSIKRFKTSIKVLFIPGEFFEDLGLNYIGPISGHNIGEIKDSIVKAINIGGPVLIHVITQKGHGYLPAASNPKIYHGVTPFSPENGELTHDDCKTFTASFGNKLCELADRDKNIVAITAAMPGGTGMADFAIKFRDRFFDVGIAEQHAVTMAAGMAAAGLKPVVAVYSTFLQRAYDNLIHDIALQKLPVLIALDRAGLSGQDGETHQGMFDLSYLNCIPDITVAAPSCALELELMMDLGYENFDSGEGPFIIRYPNKDTFERANAYCEKTPIRFGKAVVLKEGKQLTLIAVGSMVETALRAEEILRKKGISATVINARFLKPLDEETIELWAFKTGCILTLEDNCITGGFGQKVVNFLSDTNCIVENMAIPEKFIPQGTISQLKQMCSMTAEDAAAMGEELLERKQLAKSINI
ncbi:MAG: 1-deoxy-D-xylulose-5-phosphate synthase [Clostridiales bacterium]|jgi:1-deoxy-D-xylulose-5-phosphate synthase|nr:1-deoxy-D-xylulose-5-phosphate synthase [Clostridiales bacterium]